MKFHLLCPFQLMWNNDPLCQFLSLLRISSVVVIVFRRIQNKGIEINLLHTAVYYYWPPSSLPSASLAYDLSNHDAYTFVLLQDFIVSGFFSRFIYRFVNNKSTSYFLWSCCHCSQTRKRKQAFSFSACISTCVPFCSTCVIPMQLYLQAGIS